jgi:hypothetical protein
LVKESDNVDAICALVCKGMGSGQTAKEPPFLAIARARFAIDPIALQEFSHCIPGCDQTTVRLHCLDVIAAIGEQDGLACIKDIGGRVGVGIPRLPWIAHVGQRTPQLNIA